MATTLETPDPLDEVAIGVMSPPRAGMIESLPRDCIESWPGNPRKHFAPAKIAQLAASIAAKGVLQNLVVRPHPDKPGLYEIAAGESRWRACGEIVAAGAAAPDMPLPCRVQELSDRDMLEMALAENIQRAELTPFEEAEGFARLRALDVPTAVIALRIGKSQRYVQLRLDLVERLHPKAQKALRDGALTVEAARVLTRAPEKRQAEVLKLLSDEEWKYDNDDRPPTADQVAELVADTLIPLAVARFDVALYSGEFFATDDEPDRRYFADVGQFEKLQTAWLRDKRKELGAAWTTIYEHHDKYSDVGGADQRLPHEFTKADKGDKKAGALIVTGKHHSIAIFEGVKKYDRTETRRPAVRPSSGGGIPQPELTKAFLIECRNRKTLALQDAVARDPETAKRALCLALMGGNDAVHLRIENPRRDDQVLSPEIAARAENFRGRFAGHLSGARAAETGWDVALRIKVGRFSGPASAEQNAVAAALAQISGAELDALLAVLAAPMVGSFNSWSPALGDDGAAIALAAEGAAARLAETFVLDAAFLAKCRMAQLEAIRRDLIALGLPCPAGATGPKLRANILAVAEEAHAAMYVPPWCRFGTEAELKALVKAVPPAPAETKKGPAKPKAKKAKVKAKVKVKAKRNAAGLTEGQLAGHAKNQKASRKPAAKTPARKPARKSKPKKKKS